MNRFKINWPFYGAILGSVLIIALIALLSSRNSASKPNLTWKRPPQNVPSPVSTAEDAPLMMVATDVGVGSGWAIHPEIVVTAAHVVDDSPPRFLMLEDHTMIFPIAYVLSDKYDIAFIQVAPQDWDHYTLASPQAEPKRGDTITSHGWWDGIVVESTGTVFGIWSVDTLVVDLAIRPGMSGGPVLNEDGEVIGMNVAVTLRVGRTVGYIVSLQALRETYGTLEWTDFRPTGGATR
jgi:S1-C subfamily serine protease